jgi:hypothetical protein
MHNTVKEKVSTIRIIVAIRTDAMNVLLCISTNLISFSLDADEEEDMVEIRVPRFWNIKSHIILGNTIFS